MIVPVVTVSTCAELYKFSVRPCLGHPVNKRDMIIEPPEDRDTIEELSSDHKKEDESSSGHPVPAALVGLEDIPEHTSSLHSNNKN